MTDEIHSCSYYCDRPACIKAQRDELVRMYVEVPPAERVSVPEEVRAALEWYASDPSVWVSFSPGDYEKQFNEANESPYLYRIGDDRRGHPQFVPNEVRAQEALQAWDAAISADGWNDQ